MSPGLGIISVLWIPTVSIREPKFSFQAFKAVLNWHQILIPYPKKQNITGREPKMWSQFRAKHKIWVQNQDLVPD